MEEHPFPDLKISSSDFLDSLGGRSKCKQCQKSRKYYCYNCYIPVPELEGKIPKIKLPVKVDVIKHPSEVDGKSTAVHATVIAPDDVTVYTYPCIPDYDDKSKVVLVFPGETSVTLADLAQKYDQNNDSSENKLKRKAYSDMEAESNTAKVPKLNDVEKDKAELDSTKCSANCENTVNRPYTDASKKDDENECCGNVVDNHELVTEREEISDGPKSDETENKNGKISDFKLEKVIFIDSTWNQTKTICSDERLTGFHCVELEMQETKFWRHQKDIPDTYLSTVEAIYYFLREYHEHFIQTEYNGEYDNLLFFFTYMYKKIRTMYEGGHELKAYKKRTGK